MGGSHPGWISPRQGTRARIAHAHLPARCHARDRSMDTRLVPEENERPRDVEKDPPSVHVDTQPRTTTPNEGSIGGWHTVRRNNDETKQKRDQHQQKMSTYKEPNHVLWMVGTTTLLVKRA